MPEIKLIGCYQDGDTFYRECDDMVITSYPGSVKHDGDMIGADAARACFWCEFPSYTDDVS